MNKKRFKPGDVLPVTPPIKKWVGKTATKIRIHDYIPIGDMYVVVPLGIPPNVVPSFICTHRDLESAMNVIERTKHMEYQVGDYAYIRKDLVPEKQYGSMTLRNYMIPADRRVKICSVDTSDNTYLAAFGDEKYWYAAEMFESKQKRVSLSQKIVVTTDGKVTTATLYDGKTKKNVALASCNPRDEFDFGIGAQLAVERLFLPSQNVMQKSSGVNGYAVCNRTEEGLTQGNVYRIRDGFFVDDDDDRRPMTDTGFASADEVNGWHDGSLTLLSGEALQTLGVQD